MNVTCPSCKTVYRVDPAKVSAHGIRARCSTCAGVIPISASPPIVPSPAFEAPPESPVQPTPPVPVFPGGGGGGTPPAVRPAFAPAAPLATPPLASAPMPPTTAPIEMPPTAQPPSPPAAQSPLTAPVQPRAETEPPARPKRTNPFLSQDPKVKARRLARALVSDLVVYHPAKRRDGLRDGSLKLLFEEEIQKSWEEYVDQVGTALANSTPFFNEALNEILADGRPVF